VQRVVETGPYSGNGPISRQCEALISKSMGAGTALLTPSCTAALELAALLIDIGPGDEVIMPSFTFVSCANAFVLRGAVPVFVDVRPDTMNMDETRIEEAITRRTKAILIVHYGGVGCAPDRVREIADRHHIWLIEDAAQAIGARYKGAPLGSAGHLSTFSFHETKNLLSGEGGALLVNDGRFVERAEIVREKGTNRSRFLRGEVDKYTWVDLGSSYLPSELIAAFLDAQLAHADEVIARRRAVCARYRAGLAELAASGAVEIPPEVPADRVANGHIFYVLADTLATRMELAAHLKAHDVYSVSHYVPLHSSPGGRKFARASGSFTVTDAISDRLLRLPLYFGITDTQVDAVIDAVKQFYSKRAAAR